MTPRRTARSTPPRKPSPKSAAGSWPSSSWPVPPALAVLEQMLAEVDRLQERQLAANPLRLIRHPREGILPLRWWGRQLEFFERFARCQKIVTWVGPNRPGKSTAAAALMVSLAVGWPVQEWPALPLDLAGVAPGPRVRLGCVTISKEKSRDGQQQQIAQFVPRRLLACPAWNARTGFGGANPKLVLTNGSTIDFLSHEQAPEAFEQFAWHGVWIDEAVDEWVFHRVVSRLVDAGGKILITSVGEKAWLNRVARLHRLSAESAEPAPPGFIESVLGSTMRDNELLRPEDIAAAVTLFGEGSREARMRVEGEDVLAEGLVMDRYDPAGNRDAHRGPIPDHWTRYEYIDPGYANPAAVGFLAIDERGRWHVYDEIYVKRKLPEELAKMILARRKHHGYAEPWLPAIIDPASVQERHWGQRRVSYRQQLADAGVRTILGVAGPGSVKQGDVKLNAMLAAGQILIGEACVWHHFELTNYREGDPDPATGEHLNDRERVIGAHNHLIAGMRYALSRDLQFVPPPPETGAPGSAAWDLAEQQRKAAARRHKSWK